jgi:hypothetical protein
MSKITVSYNLVSVLSQDTEIPKILHRMIAKFPNFNLLLNSHRRFSHVSKGKTVPLQAWTGPEGSRRLRLPDFKTIGT